MTCRRTCWRWRRSSVRRGASVYRAASRPKTALALLLEHEFALAIVDVQMPGMNGFELAELMRGTERTRHIPHHLRERRGPRAATTLSRATKAALSTSCTSRWTRTRWSARSTCSSTCTATARRCATRWTSSRHAHHKQEELVAAVAAHPARAGARGAHARRLHVDGVARAAHAAQHPLPRGAAAPAASCRRATSRQLRARQAARR